MGKEFNLVHRSVTVGQYILTAILVFVILQMVLISSYSVITLVAVTSVSCVLSIVMLGLLSQKFFSWFKTRKEKVILLYGVFVDVGTKRYSHDCLSGSCTDGITPLT